MSLISQLCARIGLIIALIGLIAGVVITVIGMRLPRSGETKSTTNRTN